MTYNIRNGSIEITNITGARNKNPKNWPRRLIIANIPIFDNVSAKMKNAANLSPIRILQKIFQKEGIVSFLNSVVLGSQLERGTL